MATQITDEMRRLMRRAEQYQQKMRQRLEQIYKPGQGNMRGQPSPTSYRDTRGMTKPFGSNITDADVAREIARTGGNPFSRQLRELQARQQAGLQTGRSTGRSLPSVSRAAKKAEKDLIKQLSDEYKRAQDAANFQNDMRYQQGLAELAWLRDRNMGRVENFGKAAKADLEERFANNLANVTAGLSSRGLGNSTITSAFDAKNARDLAREQQRLSEMVDDRAARYDQSLTGDLVGFVERRNDVAPDMSALTALAQAYGASGAADRETQAPAPTPAPAPQRRPTIPYAVSPYAASRIAQGVGGQLPSLGMMSNPLAMVMGQQQAIGNMVGRPRPIVSNAYPEVHAKQGPNERQIADRAATVQRIRDRIANDWQAGNYEAFRKRMRQRRAQQTFQANPLPIMPEDNPGPISSADMRAFFQQGMHRRFGDFSGAPMALSRSSVRAEEMLNPYNLYGNLNMSPDY